MAAIAVYITLFKFAWHWMLLATGTAAPVVCSLLLVRRWIGLPNARQTVLRAAGYTSAALIAWLLWVVFVILGPGEEIYGFFYELAPSVEPWNRVWK